MVATARITPSTKSTLFCLAYLTVEDSDVKRIIVRLVPTDCCGEKPETRVRKGTINTPPPIPTIDAIIPTRKATRGARIISNCVMTTYPQGL